MQMQLTLFSVDEADELLAGLVSAIEKQEGVATFQKGTYKGRCRYETKDIGDILVDLNIERVEEGVRCIRVQRVKGDKLEFLQLFNELKEALIDKDLILCP
eukprot:TRINITY_DN0_c212_g1_i9.p1 TRINITY_DN0_c212_g1~~TRINITY_DN0_c212_g1_i9.p1  ORF type:complete len:101 (+),score=24.45 TRINITY_DN0_c212_g1_i9:59-361(+)